MSVSRVEYDAALKRVHEAMDELGGDATPRDLTLAALGLDEPPTEATTERELIAREVEAVVFSWGWTGDFARAGEKIAAHIRAGSPVVPPSETPKARPTCERDEYRRAIRSALDVMEDLTDAELGPGGGARRAYAALWHAYYAVPAGIPTGGSGIDGGTHD